MLEKMRDCDRMRETSARQELCTRIQNLVQIDGSTEIHDGFFAARSCSATERVYGVSQPSLCIIAQGTKEILFGQRVLRYDCNSYLFITAELPMTGRVVTASGSEPYLGLRVVLEPALVSSVMIEAGIAPGRGDEDDRAMVVSHLDPDLLDAMLRMLRIPSGSVEAKVLTPLIKREIVYRLLIGPQGHRLRHMVAMGGNTHSIAAALERLKREYNQPLSIEGLAREVGMSSSGFHHHFKAITDMSPLQYQKQIRLTEARRLMLIESVDAATAGIRVGYDDASHFSRDYKKHFGHAPMRDVARLRDMVESE